MINQDKGGVQIEPPLQDNTAMKTIDEILESYYEYRLSQEGEGNVPPKGALSDKEAKQAIQQHTEAAVLDQWAFTYGFLHSRDRSLCEEWGEELAELKKETK